MFQYKRRNNFRPNKYNAQRTVIDGISFSSLAEAEYYNQLKLDPDVEHIDCHVPFTLPGGLRLNVDFLVFFKSKGDEPWRIEAIEVKGYETNEFVRLRKLFDETHPLGPMKVMKKASIGWIEL